MEFMRTEADIEKFVIIAVRDGRKKYLGRRYDSRKGYGYTVKINEAMVFDRKERAEKKMEELGIFGQVGRIKKHLELLEVM